jgi:hypothetical protein
MPGRDRRDRTWTHGERDSARLNRERRAHGKVTNPPAGILREYIDAQVCWWCEKGPWKSLGTHTATAHGITAREVRELAGLFRTSKICSSDYTAECRARDHYKGNVAGLGSVLGHKKDLSEAAKIKATTRLNAFLESTGDPSAFRRRVGRAAAMKRRIIRMCTSCGAPVALVNRYTCSPECRKAIRQKTALAVCAERYMVKA